MVSNFAEELKSVIVQAWPDMEPVKKIGSGAYGIVFECLKKAEGTDFTTKEAVKIVKIPRDIEEEYDDDCGMSPEEYFTALKDKAVSEIQVMDSLKGPHVVHINEYKVLNQNDQFGYYILIRMDLLTNLKNVLNFHVNDSAENAEKMAIKVCRDMCDALQRCFERNMIHRDIKPENILMSDDGDFYLGDFGLARQFSNGTRNVSSRGTEDYMAPEVFLHGCNQLTDLYSLGLVLYRIVNNNHVLFYDEKDGAEGKDIAQNKRVSGQYQIPLPANCSEAFGKIVVKMCAYNPEERYQSIAEVRRELDIVENLKDSDNSVLTTDKKTEENSKAEKGEENSGNTFAQVNNQSVNFNNITFNSTTTAAIVNEKAKNGNSKKYAIIAVIAAIVVVIVGIIVGGIKVKNWISDKVSGYKETQEEVLTKENVTNDSYDIVNEEPKEAAAEADEGQKLSEMKMVESDGAEVASGVEDTLGNKYNNVLVLSNGYAEDSYVKYYLGGDYSSFVADFSCLESNDIGNHEYRLEIFADDDKSLYSLDYTKAVAVTAIDIDVENVEFLTLKISTTDGGWSNGGILSNGMLYTDAVNVPTKENAKSAKSDVKIEDMKMVESDGAEVASGVEDTLGNKYNNVLVLSNGYAEDSYVKYYLGGDYSSFVADFSCLESNDVGNHEYRLEIFVDDDKSLYSLDYTKAVAVTAIDIDVENVEFLTLKISTTDGGWSNGGIISNGMLYAK